MPLTDRLAPYVPGGEEVGRRAGWWSVTTVSEVIGPLARDVGTAIARAVAADPRILILDDALSSVDAEVERIILDRLRVHFRGRTIVMSTHRLTSIEGTDLIVVLDRGRLVEQGRHQELLNRAGLYAYLWNRYRLVHSSEFGVES